MTGSERTSGTIGGIEPHLLEGTSLMTDFNTPAAPTAYAPAPVVQRQGNGLAVAALVLGIAAIVVGIIPFFIGLVLSFVPTVLAIIFGIVGIVKSKTVQVGRGLAVTGLVLGGVTFLLYFVGYGWLW